MIVVVFSGYHEFIVIPFVSFGPGARVSTKRGSKGERKKGKEIALHFEVSSFMFSLKG